MQPVPEPRRLRGAFERAEGGRLKADGGTLTLAGKLRADDWKGREDVQFLIDDGAAVAST